MESNEAGGGREGGGNRGPCPARSCACHGLPEAEWHRSGFPRLHPRQQGGAGGGQVGKVLVAGSRRSKSGCPTHHQPQALSPQMMQTNVPGVFAAGDAVTFPLAWRNNRKVNIPHWQMAHAQGTASPKARSESGGCPRWPPPATPQLLVLGPGHWVGHSRLCGDLTGQTHPCDQGGSESAHRTPCSASLSFPSVLRETLLHNP